MTGNKTGTDCSTGACPVEKKDDKLVKSTDLPLLGNPYPPKDVIQNDTPSQLELSVASIRRTMQPFMAPVCRAYQKTNDVLSIGVAHSQSAIGNLRENQSSLTNALVISCAGLLGLAVARRRSILKKLLFGSLLAGGATAMCYPNEVKEKADILWLMARSKLPSLVQQQYENLLQTKPKPQDSGDMETNDPKNSKG